MHNGDFASICSWEELHEYFIEETNKYVEISELKSYIEREFPRIYKKLESNQEKLEKLKDSETCDIELSFGSPSRKHFMDDYWKKPKYFDQIKGELSLIDKSLDWSKSNIKCPENFVILDVIHHRGYRGGSYQIFGKLIKK